MRTKRILTQGRAGASSACASEGDCCRPVVQRAYNELRRFGQPERYAFEAAVTVYRYYHPAAAMPDAETVVSRWVWDGVRH
ncbi:hypothetical protein [Arenibaculum sp.]|uniref:hypothetical protein n=1 Tax=Arenibaculum sp. TaxID=2865862 RepID=UPI002E13E134|nr:hypothetical protein [Arenibaculum sp.]